MKYGNIFWGVVLIALGALFALRNFDLFYFSWRSIFRLWPLIFVFWGIAILPVKSAVKILLTVIAVAVGIAILASKPNQRWGWERWNDSRSEYEYKEYEEEDYPWKSQEFSEDFDREKKFAVLNLDAAVGEFNLNGTTNSLFEFETEGNTGPYSVTTNDVTDEKVVINFTHKRFRARDNLNHEVWMRLNNNPIWDFNVDVGAAEFTLDLSDFKVNLLDIDGGASDIEITLGSRHDKTDVVIDAGAADVLIKVPASAACEIRTSTILAGKDFGGFNKIDRGLYQTPNFSESTNRIFIDIDAAISGLTVERYGPGS